MAEIGYKMTRENGRSFYGGDLVYAVGKRLAIPDATKDGKPCGHGLHLAREKHGPMKYNAVWPWRLFECEYDTADIVGQDEDKVRVKARRGCHEGKWICGGW